MDPCRKSHPFLCQTPQQMSFWAWIGVVCLSLACAPISYLLNIDQTPTSATDIIPTSTAEIPTQSSTLPPTETMMPTEAPTATPEPTPTQAGLHPDWVTYTNAVCNFTFRFPGVSSKSAGLEWSERIDLPFNPGTNLLEKYLLVSCFSDWSTCEILADGIEYSNASFNGIDFLLEVGSGVGAGNYYYSQGYSIMRETSTICLNFTLHSAAAGNFSPPREGFNFEEESAIFQEIMNTFSWIVH